MTVSEFCRTHTNACELVAICDPYIRHMVWIDHEDIFVIDKEYIRKEVIKEEWGTLPIVDLYGNENKIPCHFLYIK